MRLALLLFVLVFSFFSCNNHFIAVDCLVESNEIIPTEYFFSEKIKERERVVNEIVTLLKRIENDSSVDEDVIQMINQTNPHLLISSRDFAIKCMKVQRYLEANQCASNIAELKEEKLRELKIELEKVEHLYYNLDKIYSSRGLGGGGNYELSVYLKSYTTDSAISTSSIDVFPWPPPLPSARYTFPDTYFAQDKHSTIFTYQEALSASLEQCGYDEVRYYLVGEKGLAMITELERIDENGNSFTGTERFDLSSYKVIKNFSDYFESFFVGKKGTYRSFVFLAINENFLPDKQKVDQESFNALIEKGGSAMPRNLCDASIEEFSIYVYIYEFTVREDYASPDNKQSLLTGKQHLTRSQILSSLEQFFNSPKP